LQPDPEEQHIVINAFSNAFGSVFSSWVKYCAVVGFLYVLTGLAFSVNLQQVESSLFGSLFGAATGNQILWGFYLTYFAFLVGIAALAVLLLIPACVYQFNREGRPVCRGAGARILRVLI
jgi:molybdopterin-containing oxidoreductase family membrane subunit